MATAESAEAREAAASTDPRASFTVHGGRSHGLARMQRWFWETDCVARYKETRDGLVGADFSSRLSPWLALGTLSPREVAAEIRRYEAERVANDSTYWLFFELLWRDYFHFWVRRWQGRAFKASGVLGRTPCGVQDREVFRRWCEGRTGEPFIDASMRELAATGQLSNRARQVVASWLSRTEGIDWRWGAWRLVWCAWLEAKGRRPGDSGPWRRALGLNPREFRCPHGNAWHLFRRHAGRCRWRCVPDAGLRVDSSRRNRVRSQWSPGVGPTDGRGLG